MGNGERAFFVFSLKLLMKAAGNGRRQKLADAYAKTVVNCGDGDWRLGGGGWIETSEVKVNEKSARRNLFLLSNYWMDACLELE